MKQVITIGREYGSGGLEIGQKLSKKLDIPYYDKEIMASAAKKLGIMQAVLQKSEESSSLSHKLFQSLRVSNSENFDQKVAKYETRFLRQQAEKGSCIAIGRCGNYVFRNEPNHLSFFIHAPMEARIKRIMDKYNVSNEEARHSIETMDKRRAAYYNKRTKGQWGDMSQYMFVLDSSIFGTEGTAELIASIVRRHTALVKD